MYKFLNSILFLVLISTIHVKAQESFSRAYADSITYQYYLKGDWEKLISAGEESIKQHYDFKWLRQRMGYAYFVKGNYYASQQQYEKALAFDKTDTLSLTYLYYCGLYTNNESFARFQARKLPNGMIKRLGVKSLKILDMVDAEYNYKTNSDNSRSNPNYYRFGINSKLGYRLNLYQSFSNYTQRIDSIGIHQNEYFVLADYMLSPHISLDVAYHYMGSHLIDTTSYSISSRSRSKKNVIDTIFYPGHLFFSKLSFRKSRFDVAISASILSYDSIFTQQYGIQAGVVLPGKLDVYIKSSLYGLVSPGNHRIIFSQSVGAYFFNAIWAEGSITVGNLKNFSEFNGLYIYNSDDATTFRTGLTLYWYVGKKIVLFGNYSFNRKEYQRTTEKTINYNQHSFSSGIIWKI